MKKIKNLMIVLTSILGMYSCNTIEYNYPEEKKKLLEKILQNPDSITSIVKNSIFYDEKVIREFYYEFKANYLEFDKTDYMTINFLKRMKNTKFEYCLDIEHYFAMPEREPDYLKGEKYKDVEKKYFIHNLFGIIFPDEAIGFGIYFIKYKGKYYYNDLTTCYKESSSIGHSHCEFFQLYKIRK